MFDSAYESCLTGVTLLTIVIQFYVVYLIKTKSPKSIQEYTYFLNLFMFFDLMLTVVVGLLLQCYPLSPFLASAPRGLCSLIGGNACNITAAVGLYFGACALLVQFYCLLYRFCVVLTDKTFYRHLMSFRFKCFACIFGTITASIATYLFYGTLVEPELIPTHPGIRLSEVSVKLRPNEIILLIDVDRPIAKIFIGVSIGGMIIGEFVGIVLIYAILRYLRKNSHSFSGSTYRLHRQASLPLFCVMIPFVFYVLVAVWGSGTNQLITEVGLVLVTLYGCINGLFTIIFVGPYRIHVYQNVIVPIRNALPFGFKNSLTHPGHISVFQVSTNIAINRTNTTHMTSSHLKP